MHRGDLSTLNSSLRTSEIGSSLGQIYAKILSKLCVQFLRLPRVLVGLHFGSQVNTLPSVVQEVSEGCWKSQQTQRSKS
jgi:hypothetical protein